MINVYYTSRIKNIMAYKLALKLFRTLKKYVGTRYKSSVSYTTYQSYIMSHI